MGLATRIADDRARAYLNVERTPDVETCSLYKGGAYAAKTAADETFSAVVSRDAETGTNETHGDGVLRNNDPAGSGLRRSITLEVADTVGIDDTREPPDEIVLGDSTVVQVKRITGRDGDMMSVLCIRFSAQETRRGTKRG